MMRVIGEEGMAFLDLYKELKNDAFFATCKEKLPTEIKQAILGDGDFRKRFRDLSTYLLDYYKLVSLYGFPEKRFWWGSSTDTSATTTDVEMLNESSTDEEQEKTCDMKHKCTTVLPKRFR